MTTLGMVWCYPRITTVCWIDGYLGSGRQTDLLTVGRPGGPDLGDIGVPRTPINHLPGKPHQNALAHCWAAWQV